MADLTKLFMLKKRWRKRREKLRQEVQDLDKNKRSKANVHHSNIAQGRFFEVEKCASELARVLGGMLKKVAVVESGKGENGTVRKETVRRRTSQCPQCSSYKSSYNHEGGIYPHFCIRIQRSIYPEMYDGKHPKDCPDNRMRVLAGLKEVEL